MLIEFDPNKDRINLEKHGLSLAEAARLDPATAFVLPDKRFDYREARSVMYGFIGARLHVMAFTMRGEVVRVISLRRANAREVKRYAG